MKFGPVRDPLNITAEQLEKMIADGWMPALQFSEPTYTQHNLTRLNAFCERFGDAIQIRFFGFHRGAFDTSVLAALPDVQNLSIDNLRTISDFAPVAALPKLKRLRFEVYEQPDGEFLKQLDLQRFTHLTIAANRRRNFDLSPLAAAMSLEQLFVQGHDRGIEAINALPRLQDVSLSGFPKRHDLAFLNDLAGLRSLLLILGSRESIAELTHPELCILKIIWVRRLAELGPLKRFAKLENLVVEDQLRLKSLDIGGLNLRALSVANCKNLERIDPIAKLADLERFYFRDTRLPSEYRDYVRLPER